MPTVSHARRPAPLALLLAFLGCALIWGSTFLAISVGNDTVPPLWAASLRLALAVPLLVALARLTGQSLPRGAALRHALAYGFLAFGVGFALLYWAELQVSSGLAAVFYATIPLSSTLLTRAFGLERITPVKVGAAAVALVGVIVIFAGQAHGPTRVWPLLALLAAATVAGLATIVLKAGPRQNPIGANAAAAAAGLVVCLLASFLAGEPHRIPGSAAEWVPILYLTVLGSVVAFVLMAWLVNHWDVTRISFVSVIVPVVALALGAAFRGERIGATGLLGSALVIAGVALRIHGDRPRAERPAEDAAPAPRP